MTPRNNFTKIDSHVITSAKDIDMRNCIETNKIKKLKQEKNTFRESSPKSETPKKQLTNRNSSKKSKDKNYSINDIDNKQQESKFVKNNQIKLFKNYFDENDLAKFEN